MNYTQSIGDANELICMTKFIEMGYECSIPYGNGAKYDFIADLNDGRLLRIQCKSSTVAKKKNGELDDAICFSAVSQTTNTKKTTRHTYDKTQIDYFATSYQGKVYLIPVEECSTAKILRFSPPQNNNPNYNKAEDYEIEKIIPYSEDFLKSKKEYEDRKKMETKEKRKYYCKECGKQISIGSKLSLCVDYCRKARQKTNRPSREELKYMIRNKSFVDIATDYGVSDKAIVKWCVAMGLPSKKKDISQYSDEKWDEV